MRKIDIALLLLLAMLLCLAVTSCNEEVPFEITPQAVPFVNEFFGEAQVRGIMVSREHLKFELGITDDAGIKGQYQKETSTVTIDREFFIKHLETRNHADSAFVKLVCWHELGHWLGKGHRGPGMSIMNTDNLFDGNGDFIGTLRYYNESLANAMAITDELFK